MTPKLEADPNILRGHAHAISRSPVSDENLEVVLLLQLPRIPLLVPSVRAMGKMRGTWRSRGSISMRIYDPQ